MSCDMVVALPSATGQNGALFGFNLHEVARHEQRLCRFAGSVHAPDESVQLASLLLPQSRQTFTVLGNQPAGSWGLSHGLNDHGVAAGHCSWKSKLAGDKGLTGPELVRLCLERSRSAR